MLKADATGAQFLIDLDRRYIFWNCREPGPTLRRRSTNGHCRPTYENPANAQKRLDYCQWSYNHDMNLDGRWRMGKSLHTVHMPGMMLARL